MTLPLFNGLKNWIMRENPEGAKLTIEELDNFFGPATFSVGEFGPSAQPKRVPYSLVKRLINEYNEAYQEYVWFQDDRKPRRPALTAMIDAVEQYKDAIGWDKTIDVEIENLRDNQQATPRAKSLSRFIGVASLLHI